MASRARKDLKFLYTRDDETDQVFAQKVYEDTTTGDLLTPITPLFTAREIITDSQVERPKNYKNRHVMSFITNPNTIKGVSEMQLYIPYAPGDVNMTAQLREVIALPRVICIDYHGESRDNI